jgi:hypothetical protein
MFPLFEKPQAEPAIINKRSFHENNQEIDKRLLATDHEFRLE